MPIAMDVTDASFETDVLDRSTETTVVVDLWAEWCGPCRVLGPILEKVVGEARGVELVKVDVDANPRTAATFRVQSIPAVYAIRDRKVVDSFVGALPEPAVRQWMASLTTAPTEVDRLIEVGDEASLRQAVELEPGNERAVLALGGYLVGVGTEPAREEALALLARIPETAKTRHLAAQARLGGSLGMGGNGLSTDSDVEAKLDDLLNNVRDDDAARQEFLDLLEVLGPEDPRTAMYRKALTARLF
jgi:putative thioredoxin